MYANSFKKLNPDEFSTSSLGYHIWSKDQYYQNIKARLEKAGQEGRGAIKDIRYYLPQWASDSRLLWRVWRWLAIHGGQAPGVNGRRYSDFYDHEVWSFLAAIQDGLKAGTYQPGPVKRVSIPKDPYDPGRGERSIALLNIEDRVVQRATNEILQPLLDPLFGETILGFRPGHDRMNALALAQKKMAKESSFVLITEDIKDAFDNVPRKRLMDIVAKYVPSPELVELIRKFVCIDTRKRGIPQGAPLSPLLLNLYLYHSVVRRWKPESGLAATNIICYADDILLICRTQKQAREAWDRLSDLLKKAGLPLKHGCSKAMIDLRREKSARWLGYSLQYPKQTLITKIDENSWSLLRESLERAHEKPDSPLLAISIVEGWLDQLGPCFRHENRWHVTQKIQRIASECGFDEIPDSDTLKFIWLLAYARWWQRVARLRGDLPQRIEDRVNEDEFDAPAEGLCVDAAWNANKQIMEYRGVWLDDESEAFRVDPISTGSNNLGEFLAIVHGLQLLKRKEINCPVYSDSQTAISWLKNLRINSKNARDQKISPRVYQRITRAVLWLTRQTDLNPVLKWNTEDWEEIPADYGRKS
ncbi:reverse transcriptase domain-containing protein [Gimesia aquarii]|uniref:Ribonuclease H n=1 Tax=Gimesia aquarii TaxID=2527964 RepID=A0A517WWH1_9PLAN|nr:reverse transcriptase domain-containing protein [Gimesia aquarii]QDU09616.1 Ribonuclease H [Gimesia aquarii]